MKLYFLFLISALSALHADEIDFSKLKFKPFPYNTALQEFGPALSDDGTTLYFYSKRNNSIYTDLYKSGKANGKWNQPEELSELNSNYDDQSPYFDSTEKFMIFSSNRDGAVEFQFGNGKTGISRDLFISFFEKGKWIKPQPLSDTVNSPFNEENPYIYGNILLFTRYPFGHVELAKIYKSEYKDNKWTKPEMLAGPVNDSYASISASISKDGKYIYFSSNRPGGLGGFDIYRAPILAQGVGKAENLGASVNTAMDEAFLVHNKNDVLFCRKIDKINYDIFMNDLTPDNVVAELKANSKMSTNSVYFEHDSSAITDESLNVLDAIAVYLLESGKQVKIIGHTDNTGSPDYNQKLSLDRAESVKNYFIKKGVKNKTISTDGKGSSEPISKDNHHNRRTEFVILN